MGTERGVICDECGERFSVTGGGRFAFHLLHCWDCGLESTVGFDELGELHERYIKGLDTPYSTATWRSDLAVQRDDSIQPLDEVSYRAEVERRAGHCECGGAFSFRAGSRCPACGSERYDEDPEGEMICFD